MAAALPNSKHEKFAQLLAGGVKQKDAYARAGYASANNRAAASRLAKKVAARVSELRNEEAARIFSNMDRGAGGAISDLGITPEWIAEQYRIIAAKARASGDFKAATDSVKNIEKMVRSETEAGGGDAPKRSGGPKVDIESMMSILSKLATPTVRSVDDQPAKDSDEVGMLARNRAHRAAARDEQ
ncbi:MAG: hypothetical protein ACJA1J_001339 [Sulfitobacter pontiacus]|jgi:hypothetical protein